MRVKNSWWGKYVGEFVGTFVLCFIGLGSLIGAFVMNSYGGVWDVGLIWGFAATMGIYVAAATSGGHINPAVTVAFAAFRGFPWVQVIPYAISQTLGAFSASAVLYAFFNPYIASFEAAKNLVRGAAGSQITAAAIGGGYIPNPGWGTGPEAIAMVPVFMGFLGEFICTAFLLMSIFFLFDDKNGAAPKGIGPILVGVVIALLIAIEAPISQCCINPARDFGARLFTALAGWGPIALPGPRGEFWAFILGPILGGVFGGWCYDNLIRKYFLAPEAKSKAVSA